jgi:hypothetical protein
LEKRSERKKQIFSVFPESKRTLLSPFVHGSMPNCSFPLPTVAGARAAGEGLPLPECAGG